MRLKTALVASAACLLLAAVAAVSVARAARPNFGGTGGANSVSLPSSV